MKAPPFLPAAALLLWGWQTQMLMLAVALAVLLEGHRLMSWRLELSAKDLNRIVDATAVTLVIVVIYVMISEPLATLIYPVLKWLPVIHFPLIAIQYYSNHDRLPLSALSMQQRKSGNHTRRIDFAYPYIVVCMLSASMGNRVAWLFFVVCVLLWAWLLWQHRRAGANRIVWGALLLLAAGGGYVTHQGVVQAQLYIEEHVPSWLLGWLDPDPDPYRRSTAMGSIGKLKASGKIVLRVEADEAPPSLLRTASYNVFGVNTWFARSGAFRPVQRRGADGWQLRPPGDDVATIRISQGINSGKGMLPLPIGAHDIEGIPAESVERNPLGAVKVIDAPPYLQYDVSYDVAMEVDDWPEVNDLEVPEEYRLHLARVVETMDLEGRNAVSKLSRYFDSGFNYSLDLESMDEELPPLLDFLTNTRSGHCEYFASATVMLLRQAGIPARYASGYAVQEFSPLEDQYLVRRRHAHAWALAFIDGRWQDVDTTPPVWVEEDAANASMLAGVYDFASWFWHHVTRLRVQDDEGGGRNNLLWLLAPLFLVLAWRLRLYKRIRLPGKAADGGAQNVRTGEDSECYRIVEHYVSQGVQRRPGDTLINWLDGLAAGESGERRQMLQEILGLHYRYRFDPAGLSGTERSRLRELVSGWLSIRVPA